VSVSSSLLRNSLQYPLDKKAEWVTESEYGEEEYSLLLPGLELRSLGQLSRGLIIVQNELKHGHVLSNTCQGRLIINVICQTTTQTEEPLLPVPG
jgi:hypothetical protein